MDSKTQKQSVFRSRTDVLTIKVSLCRTLIVIEKLLFENNYSEEQPVRDVWAQTARLNG